MKKFLSVLLVVALLAGGLLSLTSCGGGALIESLGDSTSKFYGVSNTNITKLEIPEQSSDGYDVVWLLGECLTECKKLKSVTIPSKVYQIDGALFYGCDALETIIVDENKPNFHSDGNCIIETATNTVVAGCKNSVIPDYVTSIGYYAFAGVDMESIEIPESVVEIQWGAFQDCKSLRSIHIPKNVMYLGDNILGGCSALETITVDEANETFFSIDNCLMEGGLLIAGCKGSIIPSGVVKLGDHAFSGCSEMESIDLPNSLREIGERVFEHCTSLKTINFNDTMYLWNALDKHEDWDYMMSPYTLVATDGTLEVTQSMLDAE